MRAGFRSPSAWVLPLDGAACLRCWHPGKASRAHIIVKLENYCLLSRLRDSHCGEHRERTPWNSGRESSLRVVRTLSGRALLQAGLRSSALERRTKVSWMLEPCLRTPERCSIYPPRSHHLKLIWSSAHCDCDASMIRPTPFGFPRIVRGSIVLVGELITVALPTPR